MAAIPRNIEWTFSKRRQAIEEAARTHGYNTPKGMELAALRTRRPKRDAKLGELTKHWQTEAKALGFELGRGQENVRTSTPADGRSFSNVSAERFNPAFSSPSTSAQTPLNATTTNSVQDLAGQLGDLLGQAIQALNQPARMSGVRIKLRYQEQERE